MSSFAQGCGTQTEFPHFPTGHVVTDADPHTGKPGRAKREHAGESPNRTPRKRPTKKSRGRRADNDCWYSSAVGQVPLLEHDEVVSLTRTVQCSDDEDARISAQQKLVVANLRWVATIAREYIHVSDLDLVDLVQEGVIGLIRATEKFDPSRGCRFLTYATYWIRHAVLRGIQNRGSTIRLPHHAHEGLVAIRRSQAKLRGVLNREPRNDEIARELGEQTRKVELLLEASQKLDSLDRCVGPGNDTPRGDLIENTNIDNAEQCLSRCETASAIEIALDALPERDRVIIKLRFGLSDDQQHTLVEIAREFGVSIERIRQLEKRALKKLGASCALRGLGFGEELTPLPDQGALQPAI
jgi:RNA polymerase primary sigma factor